ncbi:MAG TPA: TIGR03087 family PEP-CTERM/XrtA system glycosyltransferase [Albitalea sp.]|uniref:TIGR03087 family PEP-CTERM/XrtA system glycosyltransferase n=1 Tax=Piscinibacter sp. TaxID=1903157 RepID=UPI002ED00C19
MRILFLSHRFPYPPTFGSKVRAFNVIRHLARDHEVSVLSLARSAEEQAEAAGIAPFCAGHRAMRVHNPLQAAKMVALLPTRTSASEAFFHSGAMQREVDRLVDERRIDFVFAHCSAVGRYVEHVQGLPKLIDYCDVDSRKWLDYVPHKPWPLSLGYRWEGSRMAAAERRLAARFDRVTVATPGEADTLAEMGVRERVDWFPNGVDFDYFQPTGEGFDPDLVTFVGRMDYFPNEQCMVEFCASTWPLLRHARPGLRLQIVGAEPTAAVRQLARLDGVTVTGSVPDVRPFVRRSALSVVPLAIARGTQNKILESMAMGVPVVASRIAAAGVDATAGEHLVAADGPAETCDAILRVLGDAALRRRLADQGRERVLSHHAWAPAMQRLDAIVQHCLDARDTGRPATGARADVALSAASPR